MRFIGFTMAVLTLIFQACSSPGPTEDNNTEPRGWYSVLTDSTADFFDVCFLDNDHGWVSGIGEHLEGSRALIAVTMDGGDTWERNFILSETHLFGIVFHSPDNGITGATNFYRTVDGGNTWIKVLGIAPRTIFKMRFANSQVGWCVGNKGTIMHTTNGGIDWEFQDSGIRDKTFLGLSVPDESIAWVVGDTVLVKTTDSGLTWLKVPIPVFSQGSNPIRFFDVKFTDDKHGWVVGEYRIILYTADGGASWQLQSPDTTTEEFYSDACTSIDAIDSSNALVVTSQGAILRTKDSGEVWYEQRSAIGPWLYRVQFLNDNVAFAVGFNGTVLKTVTGGDE